MFYDLVGLCEPITPSEPYLRPFVCRGPVAPGGAMIVGLNPATPIAEADGVGLSDYVNSIKRIDRFRKLYDKVRMARGESGSSRTRRGLDAASAWLVERGFETVVDTNISPYPTKDDKEWKRLSDKQKSHEVFKEVLRQFEPTTVILHGEKAYYHFCCSFARHLRRSESRFNVHVQDAFLGTVHWSFGGSAQVFVCKHMRFFGGNGGGSMFAPLREALFQDR